ISDRNPRGADLPAELRGRCPIRARPLPTSADRRQGRLRRLLVRLVRRYQALEHQLEGDALEEPAAQVHVERLFLQRAIEGGFRGQAARQLAPSTRCRTWATTSFTTPHSSAGRASMRAPVQRSHFTRPARCSVPARANACQGLVRALYGSVSGPA